MTKPKKRGEPIAVSPGAASAASSSMTCATGSGASPRTSVTVISAAVRSARTGPVRQLVKPVRGDVRDVVQQSARVHEREPLTTAAPLAVAPLR